MPYPHESELRWYLDGSYAAETGEKSAFASFLARMENGTGGTQAQQDTADEHRLQAAERGWNVREVLYRCSHRTQQVLGAFYRPDHHSTYWRDLTHVLPLTKAYKPKVHGPVDGGIGRKMELTKTDQAQRDVAAALRRAAEELVSKAHAEYADLERNAPKRKPFGVKQTIAMLRALFGDKVENVQDFDAVEPRKAS